MVIDYQHMYAILCTAASEALDALPETAETVLGRSLLQNALYKAEQVYTESEEADEA